MVPHGDLGLVHGRPQVFFEPLIVEVRGIDVRERVGPTHQPRLGDVVPVLEIALPALRLQGLLGGAQPRLQRRIGGQHRLEGGA